mgnify:CR=1 FL=1
MALAGIHPQLHLMPFPLRDLVKAAGRWDGVQISRGVHSLVALRLGYHTFAQGLSNGLIQMRFPVEWHDALLKSGHCFPHPQLPGKEWLVCRLQQPEQMTAAQQLTRMAYLIACQTKWPEEWGTQPQFQEELERFREGLFS